jgi:hypothetical protein
MSNARHEQASQAVVFEEKIDPRLLLSFDFDEGVRDLLGESWEVRWNQFL